MLCSLLSIQKCFPTRVSLEVRLISKYNPAYLNWVIRLKLHTLLLSTIIFTCGILMQPPPPPPPPLLSHFQRLSSWISKSRVQKHRGWGFASYWSFCLLSVIGSTQLWENNKQVSYPFITLEIWNPYPLWNSNAISLNILFLIVILSVLWCREALIKWGLGYCAVLMWV